jgi:hypothetical protein
MTNQEKQLIAIAAAYGIPQEQAHTVSMERLWDYQKHLSTKEAQLDKWFASQELRWLIEAGQEEKRAEE